MALFPLLVEARRPALGVLPGRTGRAIRVSRGRTCVCIPLRPWPFSRQRDVDFYVELVTHCSVQVGRLLLSCSLPRGFPSRVALVLVLPQRCTLSLSGAAFIPLVKVTLKLRSGLSAAAFHQPAQHTGSVLHPVNEDAEQDWPCTPAALRYFLPTAP